MFNPKLSLIYLGQDFLPEYRDELDDIFYDRIAKNASLSSNYSLQLHEVWKIKYNIGTSDKPSN